MDFKKLCLLLLIVVSGNVGRAQQAPAVPLFFEKTYLHTDKSYYTAGEDIWFRAYLVNAQTGIRTNTSANLYVELLSPNAEILSRETLHLENGLANGDFKIPATAGAGKFRLRAYTNWMQNFGDQFFFEKTIEVVSDPQVKTFKPKEVPVMLAVAINTATVGTNHLYFFPEGGTMVAGVRCKVAFKAVDAYGKGLSIKGKILAANGDSVAALETSHSGLGSFTITPMGGNAYTAKGKYYGMELFSQPLPAALSTGFTLSITEADPNNYTATIQADAATAGLAAGAKLRIYVRHSGKINIKDSVVLSGQKATLTLPKSAMQEGINAITLYDEKLKPQCERLVFVQSTNPVTATITASQGNYEPRQKTNLEIAITDAEKQPLQARLSLAVTDADMIPGANSHIVSYLMLQSEIHGDIENPVQYFDMTNPNRLQQLDLLLQTQGWREFVWRRLVDSGFSIKCLPEPGITVSGRVEKKFGKSGLKDMNITLFAGNSRGDKIYFTKTDAQGRYFLDGLPLYGRQDIRLNARSSENKKEGMLLMDTVFGKPYAVKPIPNFVYDTSAQHKNFLKNALAQNQLMKMQQDKDEHQLQNVTVTANNKPKIRLADGGVKYGHADSLFTIGSGDKKYETLSSFIIERYPGAFGSAENNGFFFYGDGNRKIFPHWVVDGREDRSMEPSPFADAETGETSEDRGERVDYNNIPIDKVKTVYIVPMIGTNGAMTYTVQLSLLPGAFETSDLTLINTSINGYYEARKYFVPDFTSANNFSRSDLRSTIFWSPDLKTNSDGKAGVSYKNSDAKTTVSVCVEGITDKGVPFVGVMKYAVK
ncbi:MAG: MG2 domain-containing protein [Chitinophagaceae bacterium]